MRYKKPVSVRAFLLVDIGCSTRKRGVPVPFTQKSVTELDYFGRQR